MHIPINAFKYFFHTSEKIKKKRKNLLTSVDKRVLIPTRDSTKYLYTTIFRKQPFFLI